MARILVCGTLAYDDIGEFATPLTATTRNVKLDRLDRGFGGCAMNIAYNLAGLGHTPVPFVYVGDDYTGDYARHVARAGISEAGMFRVPGMTSARGIVLTGSDGAQFTAFYPGPSGLDRWSDDLDGVLAGQPFDAVILAPDLPAKMAGCAARRASVPWRVWCPGQYAELLDAPAAHALLAACDLLVVNRHEWQALAAGQPDSTILDRVAQAVITDGAGAVQLQPGGQRIDVPAAPADAALDPTGCGDAFVAALVAELLTGADLTVATRAGIRLAGRCLLGRGAQSHLPDA
jgi:sugar/nucleoside kinase (ribokinase family)